MRIEAVSAAAVRPLRERVLRPGQDAAALVYAGDDHPLTLHAVARDEEGAIVGIATVSPEPQPGDPDPGDWRLRGMAIAPEVRGRGIGARLLDACLAHATLRGGARLWCNARSPARGFYERAGLEALGEEFEIPAMGPHVVMVKRLAGRRRPPA